ncbi:MAG: hypothetical protein K2G87_06210, partial [Oscillospiraceae bacterium]|nr:hypothetical protein [Oscillospiraceae bacterium]
MNPSNLFDYKETPLSPALAENVANIETILGKSSDLLLNPFFIGNIPCNLVCFEGMISTQTITNLILAPLTNIDPQKYPSADLLFKHVHDDMLLTI